jgi:hypothetical protein
MKVNHVIIGARDLQMSALILHRCSAAKVSIRGEPTLNSKNHNATAHAEFGRSYKHFYFSDPSQVNIEIMLATD